MNNDRVIFHVDCNSFYAAVECMEHPEWKEVPMAVAGDPKERSGIILAKNEAAKKYGVKTAETIQQAQRKCPDLLLVPPHFQRYMEVSRRVKTLFSEYTDQVESFGADEAWLDVTGSLRYFQTTPRELADTLRKRVREEIGITVSVGVSFNKVFAKLGSDLKKPDATTVITRDNYQRLVWPLAAGEMLFVGRTTAEQLRRHYIVTIGDVAHAQVDLLKRLLGKGGVTLWHYANGMDPSPVLAQGEGEPLKSVGNGMTFRRDLLGWEEIKCGVIALCDEVAVRLREEHMVCRALQVGIRDSKMRNLSRQTVLAQPTHLQKEIVDAAMQLIYASWHENAPVRALTVTAIQLVDESTRQQQVGLYGGQEWRRQKFERAETAMQKLRLRYGRSCIAMGFVDNEEIGICRFHKQEKIPPFHQPWRMTVGEEPSTSTK